MAGFCITAFDPFVQDLAKALGLPKRTRSFEMRCAVDEVVTVTCEYFPDAENADGFDAKALLAQYRLVPLGAERDVTPDVPQPQPAVTVAGCGPAAVAAAITMVPVLMLFTTWIAGR